MTDDATGKSDEVPTNDDASEQISVSEPDNNLDAKSEELQEPENAAAEESPADADTSEGENPLDSANAESADATTENSDEAPGGDAEVNPDDSSETALLAELDELSADSGDPEVAAEVEDFLDELEATDLAEMGLMEEEVPSQFETFVNNLPVNEDGEIEGLEPPAEESAVQEAERVLGFSFPEEFRHFLAIWNGGTVHNICIYGVGTDDEYDIVNYNETLSKHSFPKEMTAFASTMIGDMFCFRKDWEDGDEAAVYLYDSESGESGIAADNFLDWLDTMHALEAEIEQNTQPQPMTIEEWESFLTREREKLKRLSKTPARQLSMPDPEAIRAELKNKIPVDPRHLKQK